MRSRIFEDLSPDELENALDGFFLYRLPRSLVGATLIGLTHALRTSTVENQEIDPESIASSFIPAEARTFQEVLVPEPLPESVLGFERGLEFDLAVQRAFEDSLLRAHNDLYYENQNLSDAPEGADDGSLGSIRRKLRELRQDLRRRKNRVLDAQIDRQSRRRLQKLMREHGYIEHRLLTQIQGLNLAEGFEVEYESWESIRRFRDLVPGEEQAAWSARSRIDRERSDDLPLFPVGPHDVIEVRFHLERTTGIRDLVHRGLDEYAEAAPLAQTGAARYGSVGEEGGQILDRAVLRILEDRFLSETQVVPARRLRHVFSRADTPSEVLSRYRRSGTREETVQLHVLEPGVFHLDLFRDDDAAPAVPILRLV